MLLRIYSVALICGFLTAASSFAISLEEAKSFDPVQHGWNHVDTEGGMKVFTKEIKGSPVLAVRYEIDVPVELGKVLTAFLDVEKHSEWVESIDVARIEKQVSPFEQILYFKSDLPFPFQDRDAVVKAEVDFNKKERVFVMSNKSMEYAKIPAYDDAVRMEITRNIVTIYPTGENKTFFANEVHADPKGMIPKWIINLFQRHLAKRSYHNVMDYLLKPELKVSDRVKRLLSGAQRDQYSKN